LLHILSRRLLQLTPQLF